MYITFSKIGTYTINFQPKIEGISHSNLNAEFPLNLGIEGVKVLQQNDSMPQIKNTVADIKKVVANVKLIPLFSKKP